jgi:hypothetical protein
MCRQGRGDNGSSLLTSVSLLLSVDVEGSEDQVLELRKSVVRLFGVVVSYSDWDSLVLEGGSDVCERKNFVVWICFISFVNS